MLGTLAEQFTEQERKSLIEPGGFWIGPLETEAAMAIFHKTTSVFNQWQSEQTDKNGTVKVRVPFAELGDYGADADSHSSLAELLMGKELRVPVEAVHPWQCAGFGVKNDIDLAFKLWMDDYEPFELLVKECNVFAVFSVISLYSRDADIHSLLRLNGLLARGLRYRAESLDFHSKAAHDQLATALIRRVRGAESTQNHAVEFQLNLTRFVEQHGNRMSDERMVKAICNTKESSPAVIWHHGKKFKGRPWNAKNKQKDPYDEGQILKRIRAVRTESRQRRDKLYDRKKA